MDGLIHGLLDVVIGDNNKNDDRDSNSPSRREERSRSSWAQVVSGEDDKEEGGYAAAGGSHNSNKWNREEGREEGRRNQAWGNAGQRHSSRPQYQKEEEDVNSEEWEPVGRKPQKQSYKEKEDVNSEEWETVGSRPQKETYKGDGDINNEGWETVGKRPQKHPHKVPMEQWNGYKRPTSEQTYSDDVEYGSTVEPSERELSSLSEACDKLWELDSNRLAPGKDYEIDCGDGKKPYQKEDMAQGSLFSWLSDDIFRRPTYSRFCSLLDNYNPAEGFKEVVTSQEQQEEQAFIEEISRTAPIKYVYEYLKSKGVVGGNYHNFKKLMIDLWFGLYGRGGTSRSSSAFEHVFVGEIKQRGEDAVSGFHNWIQFYLEEAKGNVDYQGYIFPRRRGEFPDAETQLLTIQFEWNGVLKSVSSTLIGVSPEFEVALYTLCFFMGGEDNHIQLGPYSVNVKCYRLGNDKIGSVFPIAE